MLDKLETIVHNNGEIVKALDNLEFKGYAQCKTFTNIVDAIMMNNNLVKELYEDIQRKEMDKAKEEKSEESD